MGRGVGPSAATLLLLAQLLVSSLADFSNECPAICDCKWQSGNKAADCAEKGLSTIPDKLSNDIQYLDLTGNPLYEITQAAFQNVGLSNLKKVFLKNCSLEVIHKHGFNNLNIAIELDLSYNNLKSLHPDTFNETIRIRAINLNNNKIQKIEDGLFKHLQFLQKIDLNHNHIFKIGVRSFVNLPRLVILKLAFNNLTHIKLEAVSNLTVLSGLDLHNNPWKCDCNMQTFRDWVIFRKLYTAPTSCAEPPQIAGKLWSETLSEDFACKPSILEPLDNTMMQAAGDNITLVCKVIGNPIPNISWLQNSRVIEGDTKRHGEHRFYVTKSTQEMTRWSNLTIINVKYNDRGDYTCKAKNPGGVEERTISLSVSRTPGAGGGRIGATDFVSVIVGICLGSISLMLIVGVLCYCFCRRRNSKRHIKSDMHSSNGEALIEGSVIPEMEKSLITTVNPVTKPPRIYDAPTSVMSGATEMSELNKNLLDNDSVFAANEEDSRSMEYVEQQPKRSREALLCEQPNNMSAPPPREARAYPPDLLSFPPRAAQPSPASSSASTAPDTTRLPSQSAIHSPIHSPIYGTNPNMFRTLPYSRSQSPFHSPVCPPVVTPRQGYVTIPRRPRIPSWSSTASTMTPGLQTEYVEPVYDNLGLRTTADGSSVLSLNKAGLEQQFSPMRNRPLPATPGSYQGPQPMLYAPIEEQERAPSPAPSTPYSSTLPRVNGNSLHLQLSPTENQVNRRQRNTPETGILKRFTLSEPSDRQSPSLSNGRIYDTTANDSFGRSGKVPPRPPPKPKKKSPTESGGPLFEDEGEDGTEV